MTDVAETEPGVVGAAHMEVRLSMGKTFWQANYESAPSDDLLTTHTEQGRSPIRLRGSTQIWPFLETRPRPSLSCYSTVGRKAYVWTASRGLASTQYSLLPLAADETRTNSYLWRSTERERERERYGWRVLLICGFIVSDGPRSSYMWIDDSQWASGSGKHFLSHGTSGFG